MEKLELVNSLYDELIAIKFGQTDKLDAVRRRTEMIVRNVFGEKSKYLKDLSSIRFYPMVIPASTESEMRSWKSGTEQLTNLINTMKEELWVFGIQEAGIPVDKIEDKKSSGKIFIVHGHDELMKQTVARTIEKLGLKPIILHEQPNTGRTIIEKFTDYSDVGFSIVLLSPDDIAYSKEGTSEQAKFRARQNVILELGYFLGTLGRNRVLALFNQVENFEMPSDYSGVLFVPYEVSGRWQFDLIRELKSCGYEVDANRLVE